MKCKNLETTSQSSVPKNRVKRNLQAFFQISAATITLLEKEIGIWSKNPKWGDYKYTCLERTPKKNSHHGNNLAKKIGLKFEEEKHIYIISTCLLYSSDQSYHHEWTRLNYVPPDRMQWREHSIASLIFLSKTYNLNLIIRKHEANMN